MMDQKPWYQSTTIWAAALGVVVAVLTKLGLLDFQTFIEVASVAGFGTAIGMRKKMGGLSK